MDILQTMRQRKSIRAFKPDPVKKRTLKEILEASVRAPSAMNSQPWEFTVVGGEPLERIKQESAARFRSGDEGAPEFSSGGWPKESVYRRRQVDLAKGLFALMDIKREDKEKRMAWMERGFRLFDAPAAIFICVDRSLPESDPLLDIGAVMQNICLAAPDFGLGTCIATQGVTYPDVIRKHAPIGEDKRIIIAVAIGFPDWDFPANAFDSPREDVEDLTDWVGMDHA
jgi:nitroreductase